MTVSDPVVGGAHIENTGRQFTVPVPAARSVGLIDVTATAMSLFAKSQVASAIKRVSRMRLRTLAGNSAAD
jgi:hypothetical protein